MERSEGDMSLKNPVTPPGIDPGTVRLVAQRLNRYVTLGPLFVSYTRFKWTGHAYNIAIAKTGNAFGGENLIFIVILESIIMISK
jgi:hypothetical protein